MKQTERITSQALINYMAKKYLTGGQPFRDFIRATGLATGIIFEIGDGYALDLYHPETIDAHPHGQRTRYGSEEEAQDALRRAIANAPGNRSAWTTESEYNAAQALIDYMTEHFLTGSEEFREFIRATRLATGRIFKDGDRYALECLAPGIIDDYPNGHRTSHSTQENAASRLAYLKAHTPPFRNSYGGILLETFIQAHDLTGDTYACDGDRQRWEAITE